MERTLEFRFEERTIHDGKDCKVRFVLQQKWIEYNAIVFEWRDIPSVKAGE